MWIRQFLAATLLAGASAAHAGPIFTDNFDADALSLNQASFLGGWTVGGDGTVDLIGAVGFWDLMPGNGRYVDLDGSSDEGGVFANSWDLRAGVTYAASFYLAGNHRNAGDDLVSVTFGSTGVQLVVGQDEAFGVTQLLFKPSSDGLYSLSFFNAGSDKQGALLDNVSLEVIPERQLQFAALDANQIPEPSTGLLVLAGFAGLGVFGRRRKS